MAPRRTKAEPGTGVARLGELLDQAGMGGRGRRSPLARWLRAHHEAFAAMLADKDPNWTEVAAALAAMGVLDGGGRPPTGERVRKAWWEARQTRRAALPGASTLPSTAPDVSGQIAPAVRDVSGLTPAGVGMPTARSRLDIRPASPRGAISAPAPALPQPHDPGLPHQGTSDVLPVRQQVSPPDVASEQVRDLLLQIDATRMPRPKVVP